MGGIIDIAEKSLAGPASQSFLAAEAVAIAADAAVWQLGEIQAGIAELDHARSVSHEKAAKWLRSWGKPSETKPPRLRL